MTHQVREQLQATLGTAYTLERELGGGGMSRVFVAEETALRRKVVVKVLPPELTAGVNVERFNREILLAAKLQHPHIVPVLAAGETQGLPYYTMPLVEGESLRARLGRGPLTVPDAVGVLRDVAKALAYAHEHGIVHRDIKPDNVLLTGGSATVTDFGIAKAISASRTHGAGETLTQVGTSIGTPTYMSPEQAAGDPDTDHRTDIYSFGCMAYELLAGQPPFAEKSPRRLLAAHMGEKPRALSELRPDVPPMLTDLVMQCLGKEAEERPQSATDLVRVLGIVTSSGSSAAMPAVLLGGAGMFRKALAIYAAAFVVVAILAKAAIVGIGLPDWVFPGSLIVMALGLPVVLWTGYVHRVARRVATATPTFTPGGSPGTTAHGTMATMALKVAPHVSWYKTARNGLYVFGAFIVMIAAFMAMRALGIGPFGSLLATGQLSQRDQVLLTDFRTTNTDSTLGRVVSDAVRAGLQGSSAFNLVSPATVVATLRRMQLDPATTTVDSAIARQVALRDGIKAIVDGEVTGVTGGYIVAIRLVRADSGVEMASFRETGDGPRGLIDAADKLARALRSKAGESLRRVNATPPLAQATTASLAALRKLGESQRANVLGLGDQARTAAREAVALDSTFAIGWSNLAIQLSNWGGAQSAIDSALSRAFLLRARVGERERTQIEEIFYSLGPGRDRAKAISLLEKHLADGDSSVAIPLGEGLRSRREYARAESLNLAAARHNPSSGTALGNAIEMEVNQGKLDAARETLKQLQAVAPAYGLARDLVIRFAAGDIAGVRQALDDFRKVNPGVSIPGSAGSIVEAYDVMAGRLRAAGLDGPIAAPSDGTGRLSVSVAQLGLLVRGASPAAVARLDSAIALVPFRDMAQVDRPYLEVAQALAQAGEPARARAMLARYDAEVTDTSIKRVDQPIVHRTRAEILLAEKKPRDAIAEFRQGDIGYDGAPADECAACLYAELGRAFDAAAMPDSAIAMFERYLATPTWFKYSLMLDPLLVPAIRERLGQLYESADRPEKAIENYREFIALWKNADPELQPRVRAARERLAKLSQVEARRR